MTQLTPLCAPQTQDARKTQLEDAARRDARDGGGAAAVNAPQRYESRSPFQPPAQRPPADPEMPERAVEDEAGSPHWAVSFRESERGRIRGGPTPVEAGYAAEARGMPQVGTPGHEARGTPLLQGGPAASPLAGGSAASLLAGGSTASMLLGSAQGTDYAVTPQGGTPTGYGGETPLSVGGSPSGYGGGTPLSAAQQQQMMSQLSHKQQDLFGGLPASVSGTPPAQLVKFEADLGVPQAQRRGSGEVSGFAWGQDSGQERAQVPSSEARRGERERTQEQRTEMRRATALGSPEMAIPQVLTLRWRPMLMDTAESPISRGSFRIQGPILAVA